MQDTRLSEIWFLRGNLISKSTRSDLYRSSQNEREEWWSRDPNSGARSAKLAAKTVTPIYSRLIGFPRKQDLTGAQLFSDRACLVYLQKQTVWGCWSWWCHSTWYAGKIYVSSATLIWTARRCTQSSGTRMAMSFTDTYPRTSHLFWYSPCRASQRT